MSKPSIAELLNASGHAEFTLPLVMRAMYSLYGNIGANLDERDWSTILQCSDPLQASEDALRAMYQDSGYLLRNTQHLTQSGYVAAQAEITYRQMAGRLDYTYNPSWSDGTPYDYLGDLTYEQLVSLVPAPPPPPPPLPTISVSASATGFTVSLNVAGTVKLSVSGDLGNFAAGSTLLTEQGSVKEGFLTLAANGNTSTATSQYVVLGTRHDKPGKPPSLRVDYWSGLTHHSEWVCIEHPGYARRKAVMWWARRAPGMPSLPMPETVEEALRLTDRLRCPVQIAVRAQGRYTEVIGVRFP